MLVVMVFAYYISRFVTCNRRTGITIFWLKNAHAPKPAVGTLHCTALHCIITPYIASVCGSESKLAPEDHYYHYCC